MGIFTLEALQAAQGDCLLIHHGSERAPRFLVVDGGPGSAIYERLLLPRLEELRARWTPQAPLPLPLVVCSHVDHDHIGGIIKLVEGVTPAPTDAVKIERLWHNSFRRLAPDAPERELRAALSQSPLTASIAQGDRLYDAAGRAAVTINDGFPDGLVAAPAGDVAVYELGELTLTILGPDQAALDALRDKWQKSAATRGPEELGAVISGNNDDSIENLSSIVFLAEYGGLTMLLTGDARGDYILGSLERAGRLRDDGVDLDVLKVQHHGSAHSCDPEFFARVRARHYVISADGRYENPDRATLEAIATGRGDSGYTIWFTNRGDAGSDLRRMLDAFERDHPGIDIMYRDEREPSVKVDLATTVAY